MKEATRYLPLTGVLCPLYELSVSGTWTKTNPKAAFVIFLIITDHDVMMFLETLTSFTPGQQVVRQRCLVPP